MSANAWVISSRARRYLARGRSSTRTAAWSNSARARATMAAPRAWRPLLLASRAAARSSSTCSSGRAAAVANLRHVESDLDGGRDHRVIALCAAILPQHELGESVVHVLEDEPAVLVGDDVLGLLPDPQLDVEEGTGGCPPVEADATRRQGGDRHHGRQGVGG